MLTTTTAALVGIAFLAFGVQTITGFGAALVFLTLGAQVLPIDRLVLLIISLSLGQSGYIAIRYRGSVDWGFLLRWVAPFMGAGTAAGAFAAGYIDSSSLKRIFGAIILALSLVELWASLRRSGPSTRPIGPVGAAIGLISAGLMHGIYAAGGPPLVYTMGRRDFDKDTFRSTITMVWVPLNVGLVSYHAIAGHISRATLATLAPLVPAMIVGVIVGDRLFLRIGGPRFMQVVFVLLAAAALGLLLR